MKVIGFTHYAESTEIEVMVDEIIMLKTIPVSEFRKMVEKEAGNSFPVLEKDEAEFMSIVENMGGDFYAARKIYTTLQILQKNIQFLIKKD